MGAWGRELLGERRKPPWGQIRQLDAFEPRNLPYHVDEEIPCMCRGAGVLRDYGTHGPV